MSTCIDLRTSVRRLPADADSLREDGLLSGKITTGFRGRPDTL